MSDDRVRCEACDGFENLVGGFGPLVALPQQLAYSGAGNRGSSCALARLPCPFGRWCSPASLQVLPAGGSHERGQPLVSCRHGCERLFGGELGRVGQLDLLEAFAFRSFALENDAVRELEREGTEGKRL